MAQTPEAPATPTRRFTDVSQGQVTVLPAGVELEGEISGADALEVGGTIRGAITLDGLCHIHESARVVGPVSANDAVIEGELEGPLKARGRVELRAKARVRGDIEARSVALAEGCLFEGHIHMEGGSGGGQPTSFQEKRTPRSGGA